MKSGQQHLDSLRDGRTIYIDGKRVEDVTTDKAFRNVATSVGALYDFANAPERRDLMSFETETGGRTNRIWQMPKSYAELRERRQALEAWTAIHGGFLGRAPDHVASCIAGMRMGLPVFEGYDPARASALESYYRYASDNDLYLTYVIINPQADRSKSAADQADPRYVPGVSCPACVGRSITNRLVSSVRSASGARLLKNAIWRPSGDQAKLEK